MFGVSVWFGVTASYPRCPARPMGPSVLSRRVPSAGDPTPLRRPCDRAPVHGQSPPPDAAALAAGRAVVGHARDGPTRLVPVRSARHRRAEPRPAAGGADRRVPSRVDGSSSCTTSACCSRRTTRVCRSCRRRNCPGIASTGTGAGPEYEASVVRRARRSRGGTPRSHPARGPDCPRRTSSRARRSTGTGDRPTRCARSWRHSPRPASSGSAGERAIDASTTSPSGCSRRRCSPRPGRSATSSATSCCRATARTACSGAIRLGRTLDRDRAVRRGQGDAGDRADAGRSCLAELLESGELVPVTVEGIEGRAVRHPRGPADPRGGRQRGSTDRRAAGRSRDRAWRSWQRSIRFVWDRELLRSLYDFDYIWEVYVPAAKRRWGYYVLPLLFGDDLVGRIEPRADRRNGVLRITDVWWEDGFDPLTAPGFVEAFVEALTAHARFVGAVRIAWPRFARHRSLGGEVRARLGPEGRLRA